MKKVYHVTAAMLDAGEAALREAHRLANHTPRSLCHYLFHAMLNAATIHPGLGIRRGYHPDGSPNGRYERRAPAGGKLSRPDLTVAPETYEGRQLGPYTWYAFDRAQRWHYFKNDRDKFLRMVESDWLAPNIMERVERGDFHVRYETAWNAVGTPHVPRVPKPHKARLNSKSRKRDKIPLV